MMRTLKYLTITEEVSIIITKVYRCNTANISSKNWQLNEVLILDEREIKKILKVMFIIQILMEK